MKISLDHYKELDRLRKEKKEPLSKIVREVLSCFVQRKEHYMSVLPSFLPAGRKDQYKTVTAYSPRHDWNLIEGISRNTGKCKTELLRKAVDDYLRESP